jgi:hypothetical protein
MRRRVARILLAGVVGLAMAALAWPVDASPPRRSVVAGDPAASLGSNRLLSHPAYLAQADAQELGHKMAQAAEALGGSGYAIHEVSPDRIVLYWKGALPPSVRKLVDNAGDVKVEIKSAAYSRNEIKAATDRVLANLPPEVAKSWVNVRPTRDRSGLEITTQQPVAAASRASMAAIGRIPARFSTSNVKLHLFAGRLDDKAPFWGGSRIRRVEGDSWAYCTTSFPVIKNSTGQRGILTARHCGTAKWYTPTGTFVGDRLRWSDRGDAMMLAGGADYGSRVYTGSYTSTSALSVSGHGTVAPGDLLVASGSISGARVVRVGNKTEDTYYWGEFGDIYPGFWTTDVELEPWIGQGDSGGPLFNPHGGTSLTHVVARGQVVGTDPPHLIRSGCKGDPAFAGRTCAVVVFHIYIRTALTYLDLRLITDPP